MPASTTQKAVSEKLGVSQMTVSRALRGRPGVSDSLREAILKQARRLGYDMESTHAARVLRARAVDRTVETGVLCAMIVHRPEDDESTFFGKVLRGICEAGREAGLEVVLVPSRESGVPRVIARNQVDGIVWLLSDGDLRHGLPRFPVPWVAMLFDVPTVDAVLVDNASGGRCLANHLMDLGHRRIAYVGLDSVLSRERLAGLRAAAEERGAKVADEDVRLASPYASVADCVGAMLDSLPGPVGERRPFAPTAVAAYNDLMAAMAIRHLESRGFRVPDDISVTGFDGALPRENRQRALTTAAIPLERMGREAVALLRGRLENRKAKRRVITLAPALQTGDTTAPPKGGV